MATQLLPNDTTELVPATGVLGTSNAIDPMVLAYAKKIGLDQSIVNNLDATALKELAYNARADAYNTALQADLQRTGKLQAIGTTYAEAHPEDYYNTFGTIPVQSLGESRYGVTTQGALDTAQGAEGIKYLSPDANATYTLYSPRTGETLGSGTGAEGLLSLAKIAQNQTATKDRKADWQLIQTPASGGSPQIVASNLFNSDLTTLGKIVAAGLPIATAFIPGLNLAGAIASSAAAGGLSAAMQDQNILKGALIGGATAGLVRAPILPGKESISGVLGKALSNVPVVGDAIKAVNGLGTSAVKGGINAAGEIVVPGISNAVTQAIGSGFGQLGAGAITNAVLGSNMPAYQQALNDQYAAMQAEGTLPPVENYDPNQIVVPGQKLIVPNIAPLVANALTTLPNLPEPSTLDQAAPEPTEEPITVEGKKPIAPNYLELGLGSGLLNQFTSPPTLSQPEPTTLDTTQPKSLLDQILKYGSLASLASGAIGDLFGGSGGAGGATTPYTSVLGPAPSFSRGGFQPYTGDYETYATRPEWNFFTPTIAAPTMTAPVVAPAAPTTQTYTPLI